MNLDEAAVDRLLRMEEVIPAMERALANFSIAARWWRCGTIATISGG